MAHEEDLESDFVAYAIGDGPVPPVEPASRWRTWMEEVPDRWPTRCLPLLVANESGWVLRLQSAVTVRWNGQPGETALSVEQDGHVAGSVFGMGIVTFDVPYVFRTPPGWDLLVRGPINSPKDAVTPLEGMVEADWIAAPFTMNWQVTRADTDVTFAEGDVYCHLVPVRRWDLERLSPQRLRLADAPELRGEVRLHQKERRAASLMKSGARMLGHRDTFWDGKYFRGTTPTGESAPEHRTKRRLQAFPAFEQSTGADVN